MALKYINGSEQKLPPHFRCALGLWIRSSLSINKLAGTATGPWQSFRNNRHVNQQGIQHDHECCVQRPHGEDGQ